MLKTYYMYATGGGDEGKYSQDVNLVHIRAKCLSRNLFCTTKKLLRKQKTEELFTYSLTSL